MSRSVLREIAAKHPVESFMSYQDYLKALYTIMKEELPRYSYHQFSEDLGFAMTNVSWLMITGKRRITAKSLKKIIYHLNLSGPRAKYLTYLVSYNNARQAEAKAKAFKLLVATKTKMLNESADVSQLEYLNEWYHPVIRELCGMEDFESEAKWIIARLYAKLLPKEVKRSLKLLEDLKLISYNQSLQRYITKENGLGPDPHLRRIAMVGYHRQMLAIAAESMTSVPAKRRDYNAVTVRLEESKLDKLKEILRRSCQEILALEEESQGGDQVYQVNIQLFPFTRE